MSEQIIKIQPIYQLQRATVTSGTAWPFTWPYAFWISQGLLFRTAQQLVYELGYHFRFMQMADQDTYCLIDLAAELKCGSLQ